jgi:hypothetical protein
MDVGIRFMNEPSTYHAAEQREYKYNVCIIVIKASICTEDLPFTPSGYRSSVHPSIPTRPWTLKVGFCAKCKYGRGQLNYF